MKKGFICLIAILSMGWLMFGCGEKEPESSEPVSITETVEPDTMVAKVNGKEINVMMLNQQLNAMMQQYARQVPPDQLSKLEPLLRQQAVAALVNQELLLEEAEREGITPSDEEVNTEIEQIIAQFPTKEQFESQLAQAGVDEDDLRRDLARNLKIRSLIEKQIPEGDEVTDEDVETFYSENSEQFQQQEQVEASHILIKIEPEDSEDQKAEKRAKLVEIKKQIDSGADFSELAEESSQDTGSATRGGNLGYFGRGMMIPAFEEVAFSLGTGEVSDIVETKFGYHLIKVTGRKEAGVVPLEEVREQVAFYLDNQKKQKIIGDYLQKLRDQAAIEYGEGFQPVMPPAAEFPPPQPE